MFKIYFSTILLSLGLFVTAAFSQVTLTASGNNPQIGENYVYGTLDYSSVDLGNSGTGNTWDYGDLAIQASNNSSSVDPATIPSSSLFPDANLVVTAPGLNTHSFYSTSDNAQSFYGFAGENSTTSLVYTDPQDFLQYPMSFGDSFTDSFAGDLQNGYTFYRSGIETATADASGTLITPAGTFENVLRIKMEMDYGDELDGVTLANYEETRYLWYDATSGFPLMVYSELFANGQAVYSASFLDAISVGTAEVSATQLETKVYPNPANSFAMLSYELEQNAEVSIQLFNLIGKEMLQLPGSLKATGIHQTELDLSSIPSGTYFVRLSVGGNFITKKLRILK